MLPTMRSDNVLKVKLKENPEGKSRPTWPSTSVVSQDTNLMSVRLRNIKVSGAKNIDPLLTTLMSVERIQQ